MAPKRSLRDNPPSASSSSGSSSSGGEDSDTQPTTVVKPVTATPSSESDSDSDTDSPSPVKADKPISNRKPDASSAKPTAPTLSQKKTKAAASDSDEDSTEDGAPIAKPSSVKAASMSKPPPASAQKKNPPKPSSSSGSEDDMSEDEAADAKPNGKPEALSGKGAKKPRADTPVPTKRAAEKVQEPDSSKRAKKEKNPEPEKKSPFQRLWSEADEIAVLEGVVEFEEKKKGNPVHDANDLYDFIKGRIQTFVTKQQLHSKIRSLRNRFKSLEERVKKGSNLKPQDATAYELSKKLWGSSSPVVAGAVKAKEKSQKKAAEERPQENLVEERPQCNVGSASPWYLSDKLGLTKNGTVVDAEFIKEAMDSLDEQKRAELKEMWKKLQLAEMRILAERAKLVNYICEVIDH